ncbi:MAG: helix-turn-helix transcriptional regulator, partial [Gemmatimonadetes bacterium]|nr:helix-turn-helix transcriptional regulator [Gemmatimonadota bacterium]
MRAGRELFAEQGYDGASVRAITSRAEANLGAITYHFGSKQALYHEVLRSMVVPLRDRVAEVASRDAPPLDRLDAVVEAYFRHFAAHGDLPRFLMERIAAG